MATMPGFKLESHWCEMGALTTASSLDPLPFYIYIIYLYIYIYVYDLTVIVLIVLLVIFTS